MGECAVTGWDNPMLRCGGWRTHTWIIELGDSMCSMGVAKRHPRIGKKPSDDIRIQSIKILGNCSFSPRDTEGLGISFTPASAGVGKVVAWSSDDPSMASVDEKGMLAARKEGAVTITAE